MKKVDSTLNKIKSCVRQAKAYTLKARQVEIKLNQNENPYDMPSAIKDEVLRRIHRRPWSRYPDFVPGSLLAKLAKFSGWREDGVLAGNGSNELIQAVLAVTVGEGTRVVIPEPTFTLYQLLVRIFGGEVIPVPLTERLQFNIPKIASRAVANKADIVIICSPNNPTGCVIEERDLASLLTAFNGIVIVDEAYHEFAGQSFAPLLAQHPNLILLRTFSKAMAAAGLRIGYMLSSPEIALEVHKAKLPYNLNFFSQTVAETAIDMFDLLRPSIDKLIEERERVFGELGRIRALQPVPSQANFILVRSAVAPQEVFDQLLARGILIRDVSAYPMLGECFRVSIGTPEENDRLLGALREVMER